MLTSKPNQPKDDSVLNATWRQVGGKMSFKQKKWYDDFPWITLCTYSNCVFCLYCKQSYERNELSFPVTTNLELAFISQGFNNWKKAPERFEAHESSKAHKEAICNQTAWHL